jgi:hypothetical protein
MKTPQNIMEISENLFKDYLDKNDIVYERDYAVGKKNFDFFIQNGGEKVFCDVKAILKTIDEKTTSRDVAIRRIRDDIRKLRDKFGKIKALHPCVLISMNFAQQSITGFTYLRAMYGEVDISFDKKTFELTRELHHLARGNAKMTQSHNKSISGILGFTLDSTKTNYMFHNQFANNPLPLNFFPDTVDVNSERGKIRDNLDELAMMFI